MTAVTASEPKPEVTPSRRLGLLGTALDWRLARLQREYLEGSAGARADLAQLRRGLGKPPGSVPEIWDITVGAVPARLSWDRDEPSRGEQAAHATLTLFALHQQSLALPAHRPEVPFGRAAGRLATSDGPSQEAVTRRFMAVATSVTIQEVLVHVRGLINQLKAQHLGLDYARLADDLLGLLTPGRERMVQIRWGRDFYRTIPTASQDAESTDTTNV